MDVVSTNRATVLLSLGTARKPCLKQIMTDAGPLRDTTSNYCLSANLERSFLLPLIPVLLISNGVSVDFAYITKSILDLMRKRLVAIKIVFSLRSTDNIAWLIKALAAVREAQPSRCIVVRCDPMLAALMLTTSHNHVLQNLEWLHD